jgi:transposase
MLSEEKSMEIHEAYDLTGSYRATAALCGVDHHTVRRHVAARVAGLDPVADLERPKVSDPYLDKVEEWVERSSGKVRADVVHAKLCALGYVGSERTTRRIVAVLKAERSQRTHRVYKPWVTEPGLWLQFDYGHGPLIGGQQSVLFCAWLAWSRFRVFFPLPDRTMPSVIGAIDKTLRLIGGAPTYLLTDNERTVTTGHVAGLAVRNRQMLSVAHYYGVSLHTCAPADPESKGGSESTVKLAKADVLPKPENLVEDYADFAALETACATSSDRLNTRVHRDTAERPIDRLERERAHLHAVPTEPYTSAFGVTRSVSWSSIICFSGARYSVPHQLAGTIVFVRRSGDDIVIVSAGKHGASEVARHKAAGRGQLVICDAHYPDRRSTPERAARATNQREADFLALGEGAQRYLTEMCANGMRGITDRMDEALALRAFADPGRVDEVLGICALAGRFSRGDLASVLAARPGGPVHRPGENHSLQPGTKGWEGFGR